MATDPSPNQVILAYLNQKLAESKTLSGYPNPKTFVEASIIQEWLITEIQKLE
jgi:hypothetical protein